jgi:hypothetical protein
LTSLPALRHAHCVRAQVDAVAVGSGTVLADDPLLTVREVYRERPLTRSSSIGACACRRSHGSSRRWPRGRSSC